MGLFSFVKKALGKVAKAGLSVVTHGVSDKVISALKSKGSTVSQSQADALLQKIGPPAMKAQRTESSTVEGYGYGKSSKTKRTPKRKPASRIVPQVQLSQLMDSEPVVAAPRKAKKAPRSPVAGRPKRKLPKGALDLARIGQMFKAEGKPGSWQAYIKAHNDVRIA